MIACSCIFISIRHMRDGFIQRSSWALATIQPKYHLELETSVNFITKCPHFITTHSLFTCHHFLIIVEIQLLFPLFLVFGSCIAAPMIGFSLLFIGITICHDFFQVLNWKDVSRKRWHCGRRNINSNDSMWMNFLVRMYGEIVIIIFSAFLIHIYLNI